MTLESVKGNTVAVSYSFDDSGVWSEPVNYPRGDIEVLVHDEDLDAHDTPGEHKLTFRFDDGGDVVDQEDLNYVVNAPPVVELTDTQPLSLKGTPNGPVTLPLSVHDDDNDDEVALGYRFNGEGDWTEIPSELGTNVLPASAFAGLTSGSSGYIEIAGYDGYQHNAESLRIGYSIEGEANDSEDDTLFGVFSPAAFAGIIVGAVAIIALTIAIIVVAIRKKPESSSTGLIENE